MEFLFLFSNLNYFLMNGISLCTITVKLVSNSFPNGTGNITIIDPIHGLSVEFTIIPNPLPFHL